jgi:two-component system OmpR family response regulator
MRVLLVEDDPRLAGLLQRGLRGEGYAVDISGTVDEGRWLARENPYDALIFDVMLPDGDGFGLCRELRQAGNWTPVLMLTARDAVADRVQGLDAGADDYLVKPHSFDELAARVRALIRRGARERPAILSVGSLRLDPASRLVTAAGRQLELTPKEFALLELFMRHPGEVLTRREILDHVWDWAYDGTSNVVDVYVRYLRQKLGDGVPGQPAIEAVRGVGYSLRESAA